MNRRGLFVSLPVVAITITITITIAVALPAAPTGESDGMILLGDVAFPHELHYDDLELECVTCHHETSAASLRVPHREYFADSWARCTKCHAEGVEPTASLACGSCHHDSPTDIAD